MALGPGATGNKEIQLFQLFGVSFSSSPSSEIQVALAGLHSLDFWEGTAASSAHTWQHFQAFPEIPFAGFSNCFYCHGICPLGLPGISLAQFIVSGSTLNLICFIP